jgi:tetratricopeptide (TPR) repeat protein
LKRWQTPVNIALDDKEHLASRFKLFFPMNANLLWEKVPFFLLSIVLSIMQIWQVHYTDMISLQQIPLSERILNAIVSYVAYIGKIIWPFNLAVFYPYQHSFPLWQVVGAAVVLLGISIAVIWLVKGIPFLAVGWCWYLGTLFPVIGLLQSGNQAIADRYTYLPSIGIGIMLAWGIPFLFPREYIRQKILFPAAIAVLAVWAVLSWQQCGYWENSGTLWKHALQVTENNYMAHYSLGNVYASLGRYEGAIESFNQAIRLKPDYAVAFCRRGMVYGILGQNLRAIEDYNQAIHLKPDLAEAYEMRGAAYFSQGNNALGCRDGQKSCALGYCHFLEMAKSRGSCR